MMLDTKDFRPTVNGSTVKPLQSPQQGSITKTGSFDPLATLEQMRNLGPDNKNSNSNYNNDDGNGERRELK